MVSAPVASVRMKIVSYLVTDPADLDIAQTARTIASGELSPAELTAACLRRIAELEPTIRAFVTLDGEGAQEQARRLTEELSRSGPRSALHGVPVGIKDLVDVEGLPTTASSRVLEGNIASSDAPVVARLRAAGAVIVGKTNTQEFAYGVVSAPTRNPWDTTRIPGGSSGGTAAAISAGMTLAGVGTDTAGSIRIPSSLCGISGLKPRPDIVSVDGIIPLAPSLDACGPMARTVADLRSLFETLDGGLGSTPEVREVRLAVPGSPEVAGADAEVQSAVDSAVAVLEDEGLSRSEIDLEPFADWDRPRSMPLMLEALEVHSSRGWYPKLADRYTDETLGSLRYAERLTPEKIEALREPLAALIDDLESVFEEADVLVLPTTQTTAPTVDESSARDDGHRTPVVRNLTRLCGPVNVCRLAALSIPCGFDARSLPIGLHLVGRDEASLFAVAELYQSLTDWHTRRPPV
ncbi:Asp-tRNA(Asn)/Glu-tRNA(Gln) amidotransferase subunit GatA [soil metagenome]